MTTPFNKGRQLAITQNAPYGHLAAREDGLTLVEVLVAMALLTIGIVGAAAAITVQSGGGLAAAASTGLAAINRANAVTTAAMLAQQKVEEVKNSAYPAVGTTTENSVAGFPNFRRTTTIVDGPVATYTRKVTVDVFFTYAGDRGLAPESSVRITTIVAQRL